MSDKPKKCPVCHTEPKEYWIGVRESYGEKGEQMAKCMNINCMLWGKPFYAYKWNTRYKEKT